MSLLWWLHAGPQFPRCQICDSVTWGGLVCTACEWRTQLAAWNRDADTMRKQKDYSRRWKALARKLRERCAELEREGDEHLARLCTPSEETEALRQREKLLNAVADVARRYYNGQPPVNPEWPNILALGKASEELERFDGEPT